MLERGERQGLNGIFLMVVSVIGYGWQSSVCYWVEEHGNIGEGFIGDKGGKSGASEVVQHRVLAQC